MELGLFLPTGRRGYLMSATAPLNEPTFELNRDLVIAGERYGIDFALSMVKFRGFGGPSQYWDGSLEPFTLIAALAAVSTRIKLIATAASLVMPPAVVARMAATVDSVAPGRFGVNLITGWQKAEYDQMGLWPGEVHFERRYAYLDEYARIFKELCTTGRSDFKGQYFTMSDCRLETPPRNPVPLWVAGSSDAGLAFAARHCDYSFCAAPDTINNPEAVAAPVGRLMTAAAQEGRQVKALVLLSVIADATDAAAMARWERYQAGTDLIALDWARNQANADTRNNDPNSTKSRRLPRAPTPTTATKLIGSYETVARLLREISATPGLTGVMLSFDDFREGIEVLGEKIIPRIK